MHDSTKQFLLGAATFLSFFLPPIIAKADPSLENVGNLGGSEIYRDLSTQDVSVVVGTGYTVGDAELHPFRWTQATGILDLGTLGGSEAYVNAISSDGSALGGNSYIVGDTAMHPFHWTQATGMVDLGTLGGSEAYANVISSDGSVLAGSSYLVGDAEQHAYRWTQATGMVDLGTFGGSESYAGALSSDGSVIAGSSYLVGDAQLHVYRWTQATGMVDLGTLGGSEGFVSAISSDGSVIAGASDIVGDAERHVYRWTQATGMVDLGTLGGEESYVHIMSTDGNIIVGTSYIAGDTAYHVFHWTQATGMVEILPSAGGTYTGTYGMSSDNSTLALWAYLAGNSDWRSYHWTQATGATDIGTLGGTNAEIYAMSGDGSILGGYSQIVGDAENHAFLWTIDDGMKDLNTILGDAGVDLTGISLRSVDALSSDGERMLVKGEQGAQQKYFLVRYDNGGASGGTAGITTGDAQAESVESLSTTVQGSSIGTRSMSNVILGSVQPIRNTNNTSSGAMFGSAMGYASAEYTRDQVTILGGFGYGTQEYEGAELHAAPTIAAGVRYSFDDVNAQQKIIPFLEGGVSVTPFQDVTFSRSYANGAGTATGKGTTQTTGGLWYARAGAAMNITEADQITGFAEYGQQYLNFKDYYERDNASNPFPAHIDDGTSKMDVARAGASWSHDINDTFSVTVSGAVARSFNVDADLRATVSGAGTVEAEDKQETWGEYGAKLETKLTDAASLNFIVNGTKGGSDIGNDTHGGVSVSYKF